jgi:hypothetical protein
MESPGIAAPRPPHGSADGFRGVDRARRDDRLQLGHGPSEKLEPAADFHRDLTNLAHCPRKLAGGRARQGCYPSERTPAAPPIAASGVLGAIDKERLGNSQIAGAGDQTGSLPQSPQQTPIRVFREGRADQEE